MVVKTIDAVTLKKMFLAGAASLEAKKELINELNVFPVPDGDTGTNMTLTIMSAVREVNQLENPTIENWQLFRWFIRELEVILELFYLSYSLVCKEIKEYNQINVTIMSNAFQKRLKRLSCC